MKSDWHTTNSPKLLSKPSLSYNQVATIPKNKRTKEPTTRQLQSKYTVHQKQTRTARPAPNTLINTIAKKHVIMQTDEKGRPHKTASPRQGRLRNHTAKVNDFPWPFWALPHISINKVGQNARPIIAISRFGIEIMQVYRLID